DGFGALLDVRRDLLEAGLSLSLADLNFKIRFLLHAWCLQPLFDEWQPTLLGSRPLTPAVEHPVRLGIAVEQEAISAQTRIRSS
ncbi:MAG: hypothetical protein ACLGP3_09300, partial [Acidobacteriota bacterium]